jgi:hypothetical protein
MQNRGDASCSRVILSSVVADHRCSGYNVPSFYLDLIELGSEPCYEILRAPFQHRAADALRAAVAAAPAAFLAPPSAGHPRRADCESIRWHRQAAVQRCSCASPKAAVPRPRVEHRSLEVKRAGSASRTATMSQPFTSPFTSKPSPRPTRSSRRTRRASDELVHKTRRSAARAAASAPKCICVAMRWACPSASC